MYRRELLSAGLVVAVSALVPFSGFAKGQPGLEQYERLRMMRDDGAVYANGAPVFTTGWVPVAFEDITEGDLIRKAAAPKEGAWRVDGCDRQDEGILDVSPLAPSRPMTVDLLDGDLRVPRLRRL